MAMSREELEKKLLAAASAEEIAEQLKAEGREITPEKAAELFEEAKVRQGEVRKLSIDELDAVTGGAWNQRDWLTDGCAATVELGSDCWGTDGGCAVSNIHYTNAQDAVQRCCHCGGPCHYDGTRYYYFGFADKRNREVFRFICPKCGVFYTDMDTRELIVD